MHAKLLPHGAISGAAVIAAAMALLAMPSAPAASADAALMAVVNEARLHPEKYPRQQLRRTTADGQLPGDQGGIIGMAGYRSGGWEIVAAGFPTAAAAVQYWMQNDESSQWGHRNIILNCAIREAGPAHLAGGPYGHYWTVDLGNSWPHRNRPTAALT